MYLYLKALHIVFIVTWFSGLFYIVRLFIYNTEAEEKAPREKEVLHAQFTIMIKRLWLGITWPSAIITLILGPTLWYLLDAFPGWLSFKLGFVVLLYIYHFTLHLIYSQQMKGIFKYSSQQLRVWNEVATVFLVGIVMLAVVKDSFSLVWGLAGLAILMVVLLAAIKAYRSLRRP